MDDNEQARITEFFEDQEACARGVIWLGAALREGRSLQQAWEWCGDPAYLAWVLYTVFDTPNAAYEEHEDALEAAVDDEPIIQVYRTTRLVEDMVDMRVGSDRPGNATAARLIQEHFPWSYIGPYVEEWLCVTKAK